VIPVDTVPQGVVRSQGNERLLQSGSVSERDAFSMIDVMSSHVLVSEAHVVVIEAQVSNICALSALVYVVVGLS
jgi:hypothetical protein